MNTAKFIIYILLLLLGIVIAGVGLYSTLSKQTTVVMPSTYDIVLECQKLSSQATNQNWLYKNCLEQLNKATNPGSTETKII